MPLHSFFLSTFRCRSLVNSVDEISSMNTYETLQYFKGFLIPEVVMLWCFENSTDFE